MKRISLVEASKTEAAQLELALRSILRMFADGNLVYRRRETRVAFSVARPAARIRALRAGAA